MEKSHSINYLIPGNLPNILEELSTILLKNFNTSHNISKDNQIKAITTITFGVARTIPCLVILTTFLLIAVYIKNN